MESPGSMIIPPSSLPATRGLLCLLVCVSVFTTPAPAQTLPPAAEILADMRHANDYWIATQPVPGNSSWKQGAYFTGNMSAVRMTGGIDYLNYAVAWGEQNLWDVGLGIPTFADSQCCGQSYVDMFRLDPQPVRIAAIQADIDIMVNRPQVDDWYWIDAFYMAAPVFARFGALTGNSAYYDKLWALYQYMKVTRGLFDSAEGLWYQKELYIYPYNATANGHKKFWARGNGWVIAGVARVLQELPPDSPYRPEFVAMLQTMADTLRQIQGADGFWRASLYDPAHFPNPETSGTGFFTYAMAWGINEGLLDENTYRPVVAKAWNGMVNDALHPSGKVGWVQPPNSQPAATTYELTADYGVGAFLLAASELAKLQGAIPPSIIADAGADQLKEDTDADYTEWVTLDGSGTLEIDATATAYQWHLGSYLLGTGPVVNALLPLGTHEVTLTVTDSGATAHSDTVRIEVHDGRAAPVVSASTFEPPNGPAHVLDKNFYTRWSALGVGQWIAFDLGQNFGMDQIDIAFYQGDTRTADFDVQTSFDGVQWTTRLTAQSSGTSLDLESFGFPESEARHVRIVGFGNSVNDWNSITEVVLHPRFVDADTDGVSDAWETAYFAGLTADLSADSDGDGNSELEEYLEGTHPLVADPPPVAMTPVPGQPSLWNLSVDTVPAGGSFYTGYTRFLSIEESASLGDGSWSPLSGFARIPATGTTLEIPVAVPRAGTGRLYFRRKTWLE